MVATETKWLTPPQVAEMLSCDPAKVRGWIEKGELSASNIATTTGGLPRYRIDPEDLQQFLERRRPHPPAKAKRRRPAPSHRYI